MPSAHIWHIPPEKEEMWYAHLGLVHMQVRITKCECLKAQEARRKQDGARRSKTEYDGARQK